jgi:hypothetical protein
MSNSGCVFDPAFRVSCRSVGIEIRGCWVAFVSPDFGSRGYASAAVKAGRVVAVAALLALGCSSCLLPTRPKAKSPIVEATTRSGQITLEAKGAAAAKYSGAATLQIIVTDPKQANPSLRFVSVTILSPLKVGALQLLAGFNLTGTTGDGSYQIAARAASPSPGTLASTAFLQILTPKNARYDVPRSPCTVEIRQSAHAGTLTCAQLADAAGKTVSLKMTWSAA